MPRTADDLVIPLATGQNIIASVAVNLVITGPAFDVIVAGNAFRRQDLVAKKHVVASTAKELVITTVTH